MARFDKVEPKGGSFRAKLGFAITSSDVGVVVGVRVDAQGAVQKGTAATSPAALKGVICPSNVMAVGDAIDVMTDGEIVDMTGLTAGTTYYAETTAANNGTLVTASTTNQYVGHTVEAWRLVVRVGRGA